MTEADAPTDDPTEEQDELDIEAWTAEAGPLLAALEASLIDHLASHGRTDRPLTPLLMAEAILAERFDAGDVPLARWTADDVATAMAHDDQGLSTSGVPMSYIPGALRLLLEGIASAGRLAEGSDDVAALVADLPGLADPAVGLALGDGATPTFEVALGLGAEAPSDDHEGHDHHDHHDHDGHDHHGHSHGAPTVLEPKAAPIPAARGELAAATAGFQQLRTFVDWIGEGRAWHPIEGCGGDAAEELGALLVAVTRPPDDGTDDDEDDGFAHAMEALEQFERMVVARDVVLIAETADLVEHRAARLVPSSTPSLLESDPAAAWLAGLDARLRLGALRMGLDEDIEEQAEAGDEHSAEAARMMVLADEIDGAIEALLLPLWDAEAPVDLRALAKPVATDLLDRNVVPGRIGELTDAVRVAIEEAMELLEHWGMVEQHRLGWTLTPLGVWGLSELAQGGDVVLPLLGSHVDESAAVVVDLVREWSEASATSELAAWSAARDSVEAAGSALTDAFVGAGSDADELVPSLEAALGALVASDATPAADDLARAVVVAGGPEGGELASTAAMHLYRSGAVPLPVLDLSAEPAVQAAAVATRAAALGADALVEDFERLGASGVATLMEALWREPDGFAGAALDAIAAFHPDKATVKAARKALFKRKSAGL